MPPQATEFRASNPTFQSDEELYRRYLAIHFEDGELDPSAIRFNEPPSFLRSAYSTASDALHVDCADGQDVSRFGVLSMPANAAVQSLPTKNGESYEFAPTHTPLPACYAHSEVHCSRLSDENKNYIEPPKGIKNAFRVEIAKWLSISIAAPSVR